MGSGFRRRSAACWAALLLVSAQLLQPACSTWVEYQWGMDTAPLHEAQAASTHTIAQYAYVEGAYAHFGGEEWGKYTCVVLTRAAQLAFQQGAALPQPTARADFETVLMWLDTCSIPAVTAGAGRVNCSPWYALDPLTKLLRGQSIDKRISFKPPVAVVGGVEWTFYLAMLSAAMDAANIGHYDTTATLRFKDLYPTFLRVNPTLENKANLLASLLKYLNYTVADSLFCSGNTAAQSFIQQATASVGTTVNTLAFPYFEVMYFPPNTTYTSDDPKVIAAAMAGLKNSSLSLSNDPNEKNSLAAILAALEANAEEMLQGNAHAHVNLLEEDSNLCAANDVIHFLSRRGLVGAGHCWLGLDPTLYGPYDYDRSLPDVLVEPGVPLPRGYLHYLNHHFPVYHGARSPYMYEKPLDGYLWYSAMPADPNIMAATEAFIRALAADKENQFGPIVGSALPDDFWSSILSSPYHSHCVYVFDAMWAVLLGLNSAVLKYGQGFQKAQLLQEIWQVDFNGLTGRVQFDAAMGNRVLWSAVHQYRVPLDIPSCSAPAVEACQAPAGLSSGEVEQYLECLQRLRTDASPAFLSQATGGQLQNCSMAYQQAMAQAWSCTQAGAGPAASLWGASGTALAGRTLAATCASHCAAEAFPEGRLPQADDDIFVYGRCTSLYCRDSSAQYLQDLSGGAISDCHALLHLMGGNCSASVSHLLARVQPGSMVADVCGASCPCRPVAPPMETVTVGHYSTFLTMFEPLVFYNGSTNLPPDKDLECMPGRQYVRVTGQCTDCPAGRFTGKKGQTTCETCPPGQASSIIASSVCQTCNVGTYSMLAGSTTCSHCEPGRFSDKIQQSECDLCGVGHFSGPGAMDCTECPQGEYADVRGSRNCTPCPAGTISLQTALTSPDQCLCPQGSYKGEGRDVCVPCPAASMTTHPGALFEVDCFCNAGYFKDVPPSNRTCTDCPVGMSCVANSDMLQYQHYQTTGSENNPDGALVVKTFPKLLAQSWSDPDEPLSVFTCANPTACPGGMPGHCSGILQGRACTQCPDGYGLVNHGTECEECTSFAKSGFLFPVLPILVSPIIITLMYVLFRDMPVSWSSWQNGVSCLLFLVLGHYQVLALILSTPVQFPSEIYDVWESWKFTDDVTAVLEIDCAGYSSVLARMMARAIIPIGLLFMTVLTYFATRLTGFCVAGYEMDGDRLFNVYMSVFFTFFNGIASLSMMLFKCVDNPNERKTLHADRGELCYEGEWITMLTVAVPCVMLYCVFSFVLFVYIMMLAPTRFGAEHFQKRWKFLFIKFRPDVYWWSGIYLLRGVALNACFAILSDGLLQLAWLLHVLAVYQWLIMYFRPWRHAVANNFDMIIHVIHLSCIFFVAMWTESHQSSHHELLRMGVSISFLPLFLSLALAGWLVLQKEHGKKVWKRSDSKMAEEEIVYRCCQEMAKFHEEDVHSLLQHATDYDKMCLLHAAVVVHSELGLLVHKGSGLSTGPRRVALSRAQRDTGSQSFGGSKSLDETPMINFNGEKDSSPQEGSQLLHSDSRQQITLAAPEIAVYRDGHWNGNGNGNGNGHGNGNGNGSHAAPLVTPRGPPAPTVEDGWAALDDLPEPEHGTPPLTTPRWTTAPPDP